MKNKMEIVAQQGEDRFLISLGGDMGQILDLGSKVLFPPFNIHSIIARGYWEDYEGGIDLDEVLKSGQLLIHQTLEQDNGQLDSDSKEKQNINYFVFRQDDREGRRQAIYNEIKKGRLRQGWSWDERLSLKVSQEEFVKNYQEIEECDEATALKRYKALRGLTKIKPGDLIIVPKQPDRHHFLIVKAQVNPEDPTSGCYEFREFLEPFGDYANVIHIDPDSIKCFHYDSLSVPPIIKRLLKSIAYSSPINIIWNESFIEAIHQCFEMEDNGENQEAAPFQERMDSLKNKIYNEWLFSVRNLPPADFEKLVKKFVLDNGYDVVRTNMYDRKGGDIDIICERNHELQTPIGDMIHTFTYYIQIKKHQGETGKKGVEQLIAMTGEESLDKTVVKILISTAETFSEDCIELAADNNVKLINGIEFATLYFKNVVDA